ncbi:Recombinase zinc beta ribbon domain-containing protein [Cohnella sp. OV330]|nr:Recombinase zinc beta ribbon domain-containing protein [Cohnella sp. OV330]
MGMEIEQIYEDRDSATSIVTRDDVQRMIADAKRGDVRTLFFTSLSRFSRDALDAISLKRILVNALKVRVISIEDGYDSGIKDDELVFGIKSVVNQNTSGDISTSSRRGIRQSAAKGNYIGSIPPYGYKKVVRDGRKTLDVVPEQAEIVRMIYDLYVNHGMGEKSIVNYLNGEDGERAPIPSYKGGLWGLTAVQRVLQNENYTGFNVYGRHTVEVTYNDLTDLMDRGKKLVQKPKSEWEKTDFQTHEAIISPELFKEAQDFRLIRGGGVRGGRRSFVNVFAKMIFCSECGSAMVTMASKTNNKAEKEYRYLMCSRRRRVGAKGCGNDKWLPYFDFRDDLMQMILSEVRARLKVYEQDPKALSIGLAGKDTEKEKQKLEKRVEGNRRLLFEIRRQNMLGEIDAGQYEFEKAQYEKEIEEDGKRLNIIIAKQQQQANIDKTHKQMRQSLSDLTKLENYEDIEKTRLLLTRLVQRITVNKEGEIDVITNL